MRELLAEILTLQREFSNRNTPAMQRRGGLIRNHVPGWIRNNSAPVKAALGRYGEDFDCEGRDGTGQKSHVRWVRFFSESKSPSAQTGWYCVYLFRPDGSAVALSICHGSTTWEGNVVTPRSEAEAARLLAWATNLIGERALALGLRPGTDLASQNRLSRAYERTTAFSKIYLKNALPDDEQFLSDLVTQAGLLQQLYRGIDLGREPGTKPPEIIEGSAAVEAVAHPLRVKLGQGRGLTTQQRKAVESHAMRMAESWLIANGYACRDVHNKSSFDFLATRDGKSLVVEVKGTTGAPGAILLTRNEVELHRLKQPENILVIVHNIELSEDGLSCSGGSIISFSPWLINDERLTPLSYEYRFS